MTNYMLIRISILMQWAEGGSLDDFIDVRVGRTSANDLPHLRLSSTQPIPQGQTNNAQATFTPPETDAQFSRGARIRAFRALQHAPPEERERLRREMAGMGIRGNPRMEADWKAVHLLSAEEVKSLFQDVVEGLAFLVSAKYCAELLANHSISMTSLYYIWT